MDRTLYKMLMHLKHTNDDVSEYSLVFAIDDPDNGRVELKYNGENIAVNK